MEEPSIESAGNKGEKKKKKGKTPGAAEDKDSDEDQGALDFVALILCVRERERGIVKRARERHEQSIRCLNRVFFFCVLLLLT